MKNIITPFKINNFSLLLLIFPYIIFNWDVLYMSYFFSFLKISSLIIFLVIIDFSLNIYLKNSLFKRKIFLIIFLFFFIFFYGFYISTFIQEFFSKFTGFFLRGRFVFLFLFVFLGSFFLFFRNSVNFKYINVFLIFFSVVNLLFTFYSFAFFENKENILSNNYQRLNFSNPIQKPVVLLITDEYHSPNDIFQVTGDSSVFYFSKNLTKNNWIVKNNFYSHEYSTIHSISSLFNFNLSKNSNFSNLDIRDLGVSKLLNSILYDSLILKNVEFINFGIFNIGETNPINQLYFFPKNFLELFLFNTVYFHLKHNTGGFKINGFKDSYFQSVDHNDFIINHSVDSLKSSINYNNLDYNKFIYIHLYMPHSPYLFNGEFKSLENDNLNEYLKYWNFTNKKLEVLLTELTKDNKYRIILSGDHGFRGDPRLNSGNTFAGFYGFEEKDLSSIKSVQDLGNLINACY